MNPPIYSTKKSTGSWEAEQDRNEQKLAIHVTGQRLHNRVLSRLIRISKMVRELAGAVR